MDFRSVLRIHQTFLTDIYEQYVQVVFCSNSNRMRCLFKRNAFKKNNTSVATIVAQHIEGNLKLDSQIRLDFVNVTSHK